MPRESIHVFLSQWDMHVGVAFLLKRRGNEEKSKAHTVLDTSRDANAFDVDESSRLQRPIGWPERIGDSADV